MREIKVILASYPPVFLEGCIKLVFRLLKSVNWKEASRNETLDSKFLSYHASTFKTSVTYK